MEDVRVLHVLDGPIGTTVLGKGVNNSLIKIHQINSGRCARKNKKRAQTIMTHESHHSGLLPLLLTQASPASNKIAMILPYAMNPLPMI
jgi:hypothetical protein